MKGLLLWNPDIQVVTKEGNTPLMEASNHGNVKVVRVLLQAKAEPNQQRASDGMTALMLALRHNWEKTARVLLQVPQ